MDYCNERIVILGLGLTGLSCVNFFLSRGVTPWVMDSRFLPPMLSELPCNIPIHLGSLNQQWLINATLIVVSPGISLLHPSLVFASSISNISIISDIELFAREATKPIVAITGSNGKSTVASMVNAMAIAAGWQVCIGGNIGLPALSMLDLACELYILELSSFQLETTYSLKSAVAVVLNLSEDHMDRYQFRLQQYWEAKLKIYQGAALCIFNADDINTLPKNYCNVKNISFGFKEDSEYCLNYQKDRFWIKVYGKLLFDCTEMIISGQHNYVNALAALAIADSVYIPREASLTALREFRGISHRFEVIHERNGVRWINDSKATNIGSTQAALNGLEVVGYLHLLMGGDSKYVNLKILAPSLQIKRIHLYCFGKDAYQLASLRPDVSIITSTLDQAMYIIGQHVRPGDLVLLSPACASLDQFKNFEDRGELFKRLAKEVG